MRVNALAQWFGSNRALAERVGVELGRLSWCGVPFMGGACELPFIDCRQGVANDMHAHVVNLARVVADPALKGRLASRVEGLLFHPAELALAQSRCIDRDADANGGLFVDVRPARPDVASVEWAADYLVCSWFGRGGLSGTRGEFRQKVSARYSPEGGGSGRRWRSAVESLDAWHAALKGWEFEQEDGLVFLDKVHDRPGVGLYVDAPWPEDGDGYVHRFTERHQRVLAAKLNGFEHVKVVVRYGDHPLIRELYQPADGWRWIEQGSKDMHGGEVEEVLIVKSREAD